MLFLFEACFTDEVMSDEVGYKMDQPSQFNWDRPCPQEEFMEIKMDLGEFKVTSYVETQEVASIGVSCKLSSSGLWTFF